MIRRRHGFTMIELLAVVALIAVLISLLLPAVQSAREAARRGQCSNNLMQLGLAARSYETTHRVLPPGSVDATGPVIESPFSYQFGWIAQLLPYLEQTNVHRNLNFQTGVYQPANVTARSVMMNVLLCPSEVRRGDAFSTFGPSAFGNPASTSYAACHNDIEAPIDVGNKGVFFLNSRGRSDEIEDGLGHTIFFGEKRPSGDELGWASGSRATLRNTGTPINRTQLDAIDLIPFLSALPDEMQQFPATPGMVGPGGVSPDDRPGPPPPPGPPTPLRVGGFGSSHPQGANFGFGDGSVRVLRLTIDHRIFRLLGARADGEPIGDDQF